MGADRARMRESDFLVQGAGLVSDGVEGFHQRYGQGYGDNERNGSWSYVGRAWVEWGGAVLPGVQDACLAFGGRGGFTRGVGQDKMTVI